MTRRLIPASVLLMALVAAGCGGGGATRVDPSAPQTRPEQIVRVASSSSSSSAASTGSATAPAGPQHAELPRPGDQEELWLTRGRKLWATVRYQPWTPAAPAYLVRALRHGPDAAERAFGVATAVPAATVIHSVTIARGVATADLSANFIGGPPGQKRLRLAQLTYTLTQFACAHSVQLEIDGTPSGYRMTRQTFRALLPPIAVTSPAVGGTIGPGSEIRGITPYSNANVSIKLLDARGSSIIDGSSSFGCSAGCFGSFDLSIDQLPTGQYGPGTILLSVNPQTAGISGDSQPTLSMPVRLAPTFRVLAPASGASLTSPMHVRFESALPHGGAVQVVLYDARFHRLARRVVTGLCPLGGFCPSTASAYAHVTLPFSVAGVQPGYLVLKPLRASAGEQNDVVEIPVTLSGG